MLKTLKQQIFAQKVYLCYAMQYHCNRKDCRKLHIITFLSRISPEFHQKEKESHEIFVTLWFSVWTRQGLNLWPPDYESVALTNWATSPWLDKFSKSDAKVHCFVQISKYFFIKRNKGLLIWFSSKFLADRYMGFDSNLLGFQSDYT